MALINDPDNLFQGTSTTSAGVTWGTPTGQVVDITAAATLPVLAAGQYFVVRSRVQSANNGLYKESGGTPTTSSVTATKVGSVAPIAGPSASTIFLGTSAVRPNIAYDVAARLVYLLEQNGLGFEGVLGQTVYSKMMIDWKDDAFLIANAPFPMLCIDAGKYFIGQDASGNYSGWSWGDVTTPATIRTRKLLRNMGWSELSAAGITLRTYSGITTLGTFEDSTPGTGDLAYYQFGSDTTVNDTTNFDFTGPVNEAIKAFEEIGNPATCTFATTSTITRSAGSFITDGYKVGGRVTRRAASVGGNNGTTVLTAVAALTLTVTGTPFTASGADAVVQLAVNNLNALSLRLRVRDADAKGKTYAQANLSSAGKTALSNFVFAFPLSNGADQKIDETDANIDANAPYTGMTLTIYATPQSLGGSGVLVGGPYNFGFTLAANAGTSKQLHEWLQRQLRKTTDIDADASNAIGRAIDGLGGFIGDAYKAGLAGGAFPSNPQGGGSGVYITNLAAASKNSTTMYDNTGAERGFPIGTTVTLDFNATLNDDPVSVYTLFWDRTIRTTVGDLKVNSGGTITSAGANLPASLNRGAGAYIRIANFTGADAAMNGVYQVTTLSSTSSWVVRRYDGTAMATTAAVSCTLDENCVDTPDSIIVKDNVPADVTGAATADYTFTYDYSNNVQGGHIAATDAFVVARAVGQALAQYTQSTVTQIQSAIDKTIPLTSNIERNFNNP